MRRKCFDCKGEGTIEKNFPATETHLEFDAPVKCSECNGTGQQPFIEIESQIVETDIEKDLLRFVLELAKEAGYTEVKDNWGMGGAHDSYTIDEAIEKFKQK